MPRIFDNIESNLLPVLRDTLKVSHRADFCVGYFNLRGWRAVDSVIEPWPGGPGNCCRVLVGMQPPPQEAFRQSFHAGGSFDELDVQTAERLKRRLAEEFRDQLTVGAPTNDDEAGLRRLARQLRAKKVVVKLFLRHPLHAKLYLTYRLDPVTPIAGFLGSSNLTFAGLKGQGELNIDVLDQQTCQQLAQWFEDRWQDRWCVDISQELLEIIDESWAREEAPPPYHVYVKMAYHLSREARAGLNEFQLPQELAGILFDYQAEAVKMAARHLNQRGGVLIGDVVGLGKTLMATALAKVFEDDHGTQTLIICPKSLVPMWREYRKRYGLRGTVLSLGRAPVQLPKIAGTYRLLLIDESHNLRNREGKRFRALQEYIREVDAKVILLSATPYNKTYLDLSSQLRLFVPEDADIGVRPERLVHDFRDEASFYAKHHCHSRTLAAFEKSEYADDWRDLMRLFLVRRTRSFIQRHYTDTDKGSGRPYLTFPDGSRSFFPVRIPKTVRFPIDPDNPEDQYALLFSDRVVDIINSLKLPRYGLGNYIRDPLTDYWTASERRIIGDLSRAGQRMMGFCRTNLFKRLESSGQAFLLSIERHILRNFIHLHALGVGGDIPFGGNDSAALDSRFNDGDSDVFEIDGAGHSHDSPDVATGGPWTEAAFRERAARAYETCRTKMHSNFRWLSAARFRPALADDLVSDSRQLLRILEMSGPWRPGSDSKFQRLLDLVRSRKDGDKVLVFSQFADTVNYLAERMKRAGVPNVEPVTGSSDNPTSLVWRFSPTSNLRDRVSQGSELDVLVATDVLSEGQNLQDCAFVVNYDMPWAIVRLIQRAGRVDRIGQTSEEILCHTFLPAEGVDRIIRLRSRIRQRLLENAEVVGTDESFFEDDENAEAVRDLFTEKAGILDDADDDVDLGSMAYGIWKRAIEADPALEGLIAELPDVVYSTKAHRADAGHPEGALAYIRTADDYDALVWLDDQGNAVTESQFEILRAAECEPDEPALPRRENHHALIGKAVEVAARQGERVGGQLGSRRSVRFQVYKRLTHYVESISGSLFDTPELHRVIDDIRQFSLRPVARDALSRQLRAGINDADLSSLAIELREAGRLSTVSRHQQEARQPRIICSLGLDPLESSHQ